MYIYIYKHLSIYLSIHIYIYAYIYIYMYITLHLPLGGNLKMMSSGRNFKNHFHELLHIPGHSADSICQEDMCFVMLRQAIS